VTVVKASCVKPAVVVVVVVVTTTVVVVAGASVVVVVAGIVSVVVVVAPSDVVVVVGGSVVVVAPPGQTQPGWHSRSAPLGELGSGQIKAPGGSHCSPGSVLPSPQLGPPVVVVVVVTGVVVVVAPPGQTQPGWHSSSAPLGELGSGHVMLPGGSHCSPGSGVPLPQLGAPVVVVVVVTGVVVVVAPPGQTQPGWHSRSAPLGELGSGHVRLPGGSHCSPGSGLPLPQDGGGMVVVVVGEQPPFTHASQQLDAPLTQALPPRGALHDEAFRLTRHFVRPFESVRQQVTEPGRPQVDREAQCQTAR
jgi:hypothetical protein